MSQQEQIFELFKDFGFGTGKTPTKTVNFVWDPSKYKVVSATLDVSASQGYQSGATLTLYMNDNPEVEVNWGAFDVSDKSGNEDVSSILADGANSFYLDYGTAYLCLVGCGGTIDYVRLTITTEYIGSGTPPPSGGTPPVTTPPVVLPPILSSLSTTQLALIALALVGVTVTAFVLVRR